MAKALSKDANMWPTKQRGDPPWRHRAVRVHPALDDKIKVLARQHKLSINSMLLALIDAGVTLHELANGQKLIEEKAKFYRNRVESKKEQGPSTSTRPVLD